MSAFFYAIDVKPYEEKFLYLLASAAILSLASCTSTKFVPDGSYPVG